MILCGIDAVDNAHGKARSRRDTKIRRRLLVAVRPRSIGREIRWARGHGAFRHSGAEFQRRHVFKIELLYCGSDLEADVVLGAADKLTVNPASVLQLQGVRPGERCRQAENTEQCTTLFQLHPRSPRVLILAVAFLDYCHRDLSIATAIPNAPAREEFCRSFVFRTLDRFAQ